MMKKSILVFILIGFIFSCYKTTPKKIKTWYFNGIGGPPEVRKDKKKPNHTSPKKWMYKKFIGSASQNAIQRNSRSMMISTCRASIKVQSKIYYKHSFTSIMECTGTGDYGSWSNFMKKTKK